MGPLRRPSLAALPFLLLLIVGAPSVEAAAVVLIADADVYNLEGEPLTRVAHGSDVQFKVRVKNVGDAAQNGTISVIMLIVDEDGSYSQNRTVTTEQSVQPGESANVTLTWRAGDHGKYRLETWMQGQRSTLFTLRYEVAESEVERGTLTDRVVDYLWVYVGFIAALVLFFAVARQRKTR